MRLVFDAAAKLADVSLNDQLMTGPDLLQTLLGVLTRFRQYPLACKADIKDMCLRVGVRPEDRGSQSFVWRGNKRDVKPEIYEMNVLVFGLTSSPCSAIHVKDTNARVFEEEKPVAVKDIVTLTHTYNN